MLFAINVSITCATFIWRRKLWVDLWPISLKYQEGRDRSTEVVWEELRDYEWLKKKKQKWSYKSKLFCWLLLNPGGAKALQTWQRRRIRTAFIQNSLYIRPWMLWVVKRVVCKRSHLTGQSRDVESKFFFLLYTW